MKKGWLAVFLFMVILLSVFVVAKPSWKTNPCPIKSNTDIVIYGKTGLGGVGDPSKSWMTHFFDWWKGHNSELEYVFVDDRDLSTDCDLSSFSNIELYVQPGGNAYYQQKAIGSSGKSNILSYLSNGGKYYGACAGWYYAAGDYYWQGEYYDWSNLLGVFPTVEGSITDIADYEGTPDHALASLSNGFNAIYYGGPTRGWADTSVSLPAGGFVLTNYTGTLSHLPAVVKTPNMLLTSVHLEAYENDGINGLSSMDRVENYKLLANYLNDLMGTSYFVPPYYIPECNDGVDNDGDNFTDYPADPDCESADDDTEAGVISNPGVLFEDDFESGSLSVWSIYGAGRPWKVGSRNPYQGNYYAESKRSGAGKPTYMEVLIDSTGKYGLEFEYYRRLIGLDAADDFSVEVYDGSIWTTLEHVSSQTDSNYVYKKFQLGTSFEDNSNFKIRFMCEAGAVSEYCRVDNVKITSS